MRRNSNWAISITYKGFDAFHRGEPCKPPYKGKGLNQLRNKLWREGWECARRESVLNLPRNVKGI